MFSYVRGLLNEIISNIKLPEDKGMRDGQTNTLKRLDDTEIWNYFGGNYEKDSLEELIESQAELDNGFGTAENIAQPQPPIHDMDANPTQPKRSPGMEPNPDQNNKIEPGPTPEPYQDQVIPDDSLDSLIRGTKLENTGESVSSLEMSRSLPGSKREESWERLIGKLTFTNLSCGNHDESIPEIKQIVEIVDRDVADVVDIVADTNTTPPPPATNTRPNTSNTNNKDGDPEMGVNIQRQGKRKRMETSENDGIECPLDVPKQIR